MRPEALPYDKYAGVRRTLHWDDSERKLIVQNEQNCDEILAWNKACFNAEQSSSSLWGGRPYVLVARVPNALLEEWYKKGINYLTREGRAKINAMLSTNEYCHLRTAPGRLA